MPNHICGIIETTVAVVGADSISALCISGHPTSTYLSTEIPIKNKNINPKQGWHGLLYPVGMDGVNLLGKMDSERAEMDSAPTWG